MYLVNELYENVDVAGDLEQRLPEQLKPLAGPVAGALRQPATDAVDRLLDTPAVQQLWVEASSLAQQKLVNVVEDKTGHGISTGDGEVTLDLGELVQQLGTELGLSSSVLDRIPPDAGVITVMQSDRLATAQTVVKVLRVLSGALLVLSARLFSGSTRWPCTSPPESAAGRCATSAGRSSSWASPCSWPAASPASTRSMPSPRRSRARRAGAAG